MVRTIITLINCQCVGCDVAESIHFVTLCTEKPHQPSTLYTQELLLMYYCNDAVGCDLMQVYIVVTFVVTNMETT